MFTFKAVKYFHSSFTEHRQIFTMNSKKNIISTILLLSTISYASALWCYQCVSTEAGCGREFNWWWHWTKICPEDDDVCVKIEEQKDSDEVITRACLSTIRGYRTDIPADHYEGCRPAAKDVRLGHYVNNSVKELDVHRNYYDSAQYCFCFLDHRCNESNYLMPSLVLVFVSVINIMYKYF